jgi:hypothetical protein
MTDTKTPPDPEDQAKCEEPETERGGSPATHSSSRINEEEEKSEGQKPNPSQKEQANRRHSP